MTETPLNYGGLSGEYSAYDSSAVVVLPIPYEKTSSWQSGSGEGPAAIIEASRNMELYDIETDSEVYLKGIYTAAGVDEHSPEDMIENSRRETLKFLNDGKFVAGIGGKHTSSIGIIKACSSYFPHLSVLQMDAHSDLRNAYGGDIYSHASVIARVKEFNSDIVQVGIRSMDSSEKEYAESGKIFYARDIKAKRKGVEDILSVIGENVYINIDLDVFDPAVIPSTGTPEPGELD